MEQSELKELQASYGEESSTYEQLTNRLQVNSHTIVLAGINCRMNIVNSALVLHPGKTHKDQDMTETVLYRGMHKIKQVIILSDKGTVTLDAIRWCREQDVAITMIDSDGNLMGTVTPEWEGNVLLRRAQYQADDTGVGLYIAREIIRKKTLAQIAVLQELPASPARKEHFIVISHYGRDVFLKDPDAVFKEFEDGLTQLDSIKDITTLLLLEARLASVYWDGFTGLPLKWKDKKKVPPHWLTIMGRLGSNSDRGVRHVKHPFHSALNYSYAILAAQCKQALTVQGFDTAMSFLHTPMLHRDSLTFDLMECHRSSVDMLVFKLFSARMFTKGNFLQLPTGEVRMNPQLARYIALTCRLKQESIDTSSQWLKSLLLASR